jgi:orotate phosphoribosyltransferase
MSLKELIRSRYMAKFSNPVTLSSGLSSNIYFDMKGFMLSNIGSYLITRNIGSLVRYKTIGGVELGGAMLAMLLRSDFTSGEFFIIRKEEKKHGLQKRIEGHMIPMSSTVTLVEDVITTGRTVEMARKLLKEDYGVEVGQILCIIDRTPDERYESLFKEKDFLS